jgi:hypothetical protein
MPMPLRTVIMGWDALELREGVVLDGRGNLGQHGDFVLWLIASTG